MKHRDLVHRIYNDNIADIDRHIENLKFKNTFNVLKSFIAKIDDLSNSVEMAESLQSFIQVNVLQGSLVNIFWWHFTFGIRPARKETTNVRPITYFIIHCSNR